MKQLSVFITLIVSLSLVSCGPDEEPEKKTTEEKPNLETKAKKQENVILYPALRALNKAKSVEQTLLDAEAARKKKIQEQETSDDDS